jgi:hypothetical protein
MRAETLEVGTTLEIVGIFRGRQWAAADAFRKALVLFTRSLSAAVERLECQAAEHFNSLSVHPATLIR